MVNMEIPKQLIDMDFCRVGFKTKKPFESDWVNKSYTYDKISEYFPKENYGVICGEKLRVLDDDTKENILLNMFLEYFGETFRVRNHLYFKFDNKHSEKIIFFNEQGEHLGELQGSGTMVVGAGSTHPSGEIYEQKNDLEIKEIKYEDFIKVFGKYIKKQNQVIENISIKDDILDDDNYNNIKSKWVKGDRQNLALILSGYLRKNKRFGKTKTCSIIENICKECGDSDVLERLKAVDSTYNKDESEIKGISGLEERGIQTSLDKNKIITLIATRQEDLATEEITQFVLKNYKIKSMKQDKNSEIWFYKDGVMKPNGESQIKEICRELFGEAYTPQRVNKVIAKVEADTFIEADEFFRSEQDNVDEIPVQNGILNIRTLELNDFSDDKIFFNKINASYNKEAKCPNIKKFLSEIVKNEEDINVIFEIVGAMLYKRYFPQTAIMLLGDGENGKGVLESLIRTLLCPENCSSIPLNQMTSDSFSVCEMFGKLANLSGDISNTDLKDTGRFKELSSGTDLISAKRKFLKELKFVNYAKLIFSCNELPRSYDLSHGFWRRWLILEFPYKFLKQNEYVLVEDKTNIKLADSELIFKLTTQEELNGLLNEALNGLHRLLKNKQYSSTKTTAEIKDFWIRKSDSFTAFCYDMIEEKLEGFITKKELRKVFSNYCKKHKIRGTSDANIKVVLENLFGVCESRKNVNEGIEREYIWEGISFKTRNVQDVYTFYTLGQISNLPIGVKPMDTIGSQNKPYKFDFSEEKIRELNEDLNDIKNG